MRAQTDPMTCRSHIRRALGHFLLVLFLVVHAPVTGVMAAQPEHGGGQSLVICLDGSLAEIAGPAGPASEETGAHECLCPCATLSDAKFITGGCASAAELLEPDLQQEHLQQQTGALNAQMPQTGQGSPRSPPHALL